MRSNLRTAIFAPIAVFALSLFSYSQTLASNETFIAQAKQLPASAYERNLGKVTFRSWVKSLAVKDSPAKWEVRTCGHEEGIPDGDGKHPVCLKISARIAAKVTAQIYVDFGTIKNGRVVSPQVRYLFVGGENGEGGAGYDKLKQMRRDVTMIKSSLVRFDPNNGDFHADDTVKMFENVTEILVKSIDLNARGELAAFGNHGELDGDNVAYKTTNTVFDGRQLAFVTATVKGVGFKFYGVIENLDVDSHGAYTEAVVLKGRLVKFFRGKRVSASEITFHYQSFPGE